jgi:inhibitor of KinA
MEITPLGDSAFIICVREGFEGASDQTIEAVLRVQRCLENAQLPVVIETAPAYTTVAVFYDPARVVAAGAKPNEIVDWLAERMRQVLSDAHAIQDEEIEARLVEIPLCYDSEFAPDLDEVAKRAGLLAQEVVDLHSKSEYRVSCVGFTPGFPYLTGLPDKLATPRRAVPRKEIPAGSVAIGGNQTGIYPIKSPGGWNVIGRTPLKLFDPAGDPPALLRAGDRVRFRAIARDQFETMRTSR